MQVQVDTCNSLTMSNVNEETPELGHVIAMLVIVHRHPDPPMTCRRARLIAMTSASFVAELDTGP